MMTKIHLAIFSPNYIDLILHGSKTVESRFSKIKCAPYDKVCIDDCVLMKDSGGPVRGLFSIKAIEQYELDYNLCWKISDSYHKYIFPNIENDNRLYMQRWLDCQYATLIEIKDMREFSKPLTVMKKDRRAWVVFDERHNKKIMHDIYLHEKYSTNIYE